METYYEKDLTVDNKEFKYDGIFNFKELSRVINTSLEERGYEKREKKTEERVTDIGRNTYIELRPFKVKTDYVVLMIKIKINLENIIDVVNEIDGDKKTFQQGNVSIIFDGWHLSDYKGRVGMNPVKYFLKGLINKFFYRWPLEASFRQELTEDTNYIYSKIKKLFESYGSEKVTFKEEEIKQKVQEEMDFLER